MKQNYRPDFTYADFAAMFTAEFYNPSQWADIFQAAGAKYVVLTSKHHEGFTNWPSKVSFNWNAMDVGPKRDLVGDLGKAIKAKPGMHFGLYHSMMDWYHPLYLEDKAGGWKTNKFPVEKSLPELHEIVNAYEPDIVWSDGDWEAPDSYWNSTGFLAWLYNESPVKSTVVTNDRWGGGVACHHGGYYTCSDRFNPGTLQKHKWENCMTIDRNSWGFRRNAAYADYLSIEELLGTLAPTVSCGGNLLINVGPTSAGIISPIFEERLRQLGEWLGVNGEAIYASKPWKAQNDTLTKDIWYTSTMSGSATTVYAIALSWPKGGMLSLGAVTPAPTTTVSLVGYPGMLDWKARPAGGIDITIPAIPYDKLPCQWAWVFKLNNL
jgi:alpha-L-fucosidase